MMIWAGGRQAAGRAATTVAVAERHLLAASGAPAGPRGLRAQPPSTSAYMLRHYVGRARRKSRAIELRHFARRRFYAEARRHAINISASLY